MRILILLLFLCNFSFHGFANDIILRAKAASALNTVTLYPDSTFVKHSNIAYKEGALFEILEETKLEHEDDAQNQKFKWYKVKTKDGKTGWVFGDALAVILSQNEIPAQLKNFHQKKISLSSGFEQAMIWIAATNGRDNFHKNDFLNPAYREYYIVVTNEHHKSVHLKYGGISAMGKTDVMRFEMKDLTGDQVPDFILVNSSLPSGKLTENRNLEIYSIQAGTLTKIFEERLNLTFDNDDPSPALFKFVEIDQQSIRIEYVDYIACQKYKAIPEIKIRNSPHERCMEYVTYTWQWNKQKKMYVPFYKESRTPPKAGVKNYGVTLLDSPRAAARTIKAVQLQDKLKVIAHFEKYVLENGVQKATPYLFVQLPQGQTGYIPAKKIGFIKMQHADLLNKFYQNPPTAKIDWKPITNFIYIAPGSNTVILKDK